MLTYPTRDKLLALKLGGMVSALDDQDAVSASGSLSFEERLGLIVDREVTARQNKSLTRRLAAANLRQQACLENINFRLERDLIKNQILSLASCDWIRRHENCIFTGATGLGKSYLACAFGQKACREEMSVIYHRVPRLFGELVEARADGTYNRKLNAIAKCDLLILDEWGQAPFTDGQRRDMLEIVDDRYGMRSTIITTQVPTDKWHDIIGDPTIADAILDRLVHNAHKIPLKGESVRKLLNGLTTDEIERL